MPDRAIFISVNSTGFASVSEAPSDKSGADTFSGDTPSDIMILSVRTIYHKFVIIISHVLS